MTQDNKEKNWFCYVGYHDLKCDIHIDVYFDSPNDMLEFFNKYNPCSIDIERMFVNSYFV